MYKAIIKSILMSNFRFDKIKQILTIGTIQIHIIVYRLRMHEAFPLKI